MQISAILLARAMAWVESTDLNPTGAAFYPTVVQALVKRFNFQRFPQKPEDFDESKGVQFESGYVEGVTIEQLIVYRYGVVLDTRTSTDESRRILEDALGWASKELGLAYKDGMVRRWQYESQICFYSNRQLTAVNPIFEKLSETATRFVADTLGEDLKYELVSVVLNFDILKRKYPLGTFSIQRRDNTPFSENKYFSSAPLPTALHIKLLEEFEAGVAKSAKIKGH